MNRLEYGLSIEAKACEWFLTNFSARLLKSNYRIKSGEVDLIFEQGTELVFVEVRARRAGWVSGFESVTFPKQRRLKTAINHFLARYKGSASEVRIDILDWNGRVWQHYPHQQF